MQVTHEITEIIQAKLPGAIVQVFDPRQDGVHLEAIVVSEKFENLSILAQQRLVMNALKEQFNDSLHALALKTYTPNQWNKQ